MSNYLAIATVTATLRDLLNDTVPSNIAGVEVKTARPAQHTFSPGQAGINIFLYQVTPNATWRNMNLPTRGQAGMVKQRPQVALDLYYLLSFYGDENELVPQRLLGSVVSRLNSEPILTPQRIKETITSVTGSNPDHYLADSDLAEQIERVRFTPLTLNLEELSKLWSLLVHNAPYALSLTYQASVVLIEEEITPTKGLPVREAKLHVMPFRQPVIESVSPTIITAGSEIVIKGQNLRADKVKVTFGNLEVEPNSDKVSDKQITVALPTGLRAGVNSVQVVHQLDFGTDSGSEPHKGFESNVAAFVLRPTITASEGLAITFNPSVGKSQRVVLLLNKVESPATGYTFNAPKDNGITSGDETDTITFPISNVEPGEYLVRVQVDGAESVLESTDGQYTGPTVTIP